MSTAMSLFLRQIVLHNGLPFDVKLPRAAPTAYEALSDDAFNSLMEHTASAYASGQSVSLAAFEKQLSKEVGL